MANNKWKIIISFCFIIAAVVMAGYYFTMREKSQRINLTIGLVEGSIYAAPLLVAESEGFLQDVGINLEIKMFDSGRPALTAMFEQENPDIVSPATTPIVFSSFGRKDYAIFAGLVKLNNETQLLVRSGRGIKVPADLSGKKIGATKGTIGHYFLDLFLRQNGLKISDVEIFDLRAAELIGALADGRVDAISTWEPHIFNAKQKMDAEVRVLSGKGILKEGAYFVARKDFIENNREILVKFLKAIKRANNFLAERPLASMDIVSEKLGVDKITVISLWENYEFDLFLDQSILTFLENEAKWAIENRLVDAAEIPDYSEYLYTGIMETIK